MIGKIINRLHELIKKISSIESSTKLIYQFNEDQYALLQLYNLFDQNIFIPITNWSISPKEVLHICNDIVLNKRRNIIEFGSGFSTLCLAQLFKTKNIKASFISIEDNNEWAEEMNSLIKEFKLEEYVKIVIAPITDVSEKYAKQPQKKWYDVEILEAELKDIDNFDLVIVDGPFGGTTSFARYSAVPYLKEKLAGKYTIFLDDSYRKDEKQIALEWKEILKAHLKDCKRYSVLTSETVFDVFPYGTTF